MTAKPRWLRGWGRVALAAGLVAAAGGPGCIRHIHPTPAVPPEQRQACDLMPQRARDHVYVFLIHGTDPFDLANLTGVRGYLLSLGYIKTYHGQLYHNYAFEREILRVRERDPEARFVLVGFSFGANGVRDLAAALQRHDIPVDLVVYLGGNTLTEGEAAQPDNAARIINVLGEGYLFHGATLDRADNVQLTDTWHFGTPTHPQTLDLLARELMVVAGRVSVTERVYETKPPALPVGPGWEFLTPAPEVVPPVPLWAPRPVPESEGK